MILDWLGAGRHDGRWIESVYLFWWMWIGIASEVGRGTYPGAVHNTPPILWLSEYPSLGVINNK